MNDFNEAKQSLLYVANLVAPTGKEQRAFIKMCSEMDRDNLEPRDYLRRLVGSIYDGLAYGNWPA